VLGEATRSTVRAKLGEPAGTRSEEKVTIFEYDPAQGVALPAPRGEATAARFGKMQLIFVDDLLLNVSLAEPDKPVARDLIHELLGEPDEVPERDEEEEEGPTEIFDVEGSDDEPLLSFAAHFDASGSLEALSLCAETEGDLEETLPPG
jgi:hypothetical protein